MSEQVLIARAQGRPWRKQDVEGLPDTGGAYALVIDLARAARLPIKRLDEPRLAPGCYVYCGSAEGPGGLAARIRRHLRPGKALHWHVDHLTRRGRATMVLARPGGRECELVADLLEWPDVSAPIAGFGSTDCRTCASHLLRVPPGLAFSRVFRVGASDPGFRSTT